MTTPLWCLAFLAIFPIIPLATIGGAARVKDAGAFDNNYPRLGFMRAEGLTHRAWAAQQNAWEGLALFTAAILVTHMAGIPAQQISTLCIAFVVCRVLHAIFYIGNIAILRSLAFLSSFGIALWMFKLAATASPIAI